MVTIARLTRATPQTRRSHILDVAWSIFMENGYAATSMTMIAMCLGGSKATLYKYFSSKEALFEAAVADRCERKLSDIIGPSQELDIRSALQGCGERFLKVLFQPDSLRLYRLVSGEGARHPEIVRCFFGAALDKTIRHVAQMLDRSAALDEISCTDPKRVAEQFLALVRGDLHFRVICGVAAVPDEATMRTYVSEAVDVIWKAFRNSSD